MSKTRQTRFRAKSEPPVRSMAVTFPNGGVLADRASEWDRLVYASRSAMRIRTAREEWMVPPHRALWVPAGVRHRVEMKGPVSVRSLYFRPGLSRRLPRTCRVMSVSALFRELILHIARRAIVDPYLVSDSHAVAMLLEQLRAIEGVPLQLPLPREARALEATRLLSTSEGTRWTLEKLGRASGASARTLQRLFLSETELTFEKWRQRARLARSVELLSEGRSVTSVAFEVGYDSPSAFIAMFRRELGSTPRRYVQGSARDRAALSR
jgi:AraC-like DNA-binding protein